MTLAPLIFIGLWISLNFPTGCAGWVCLKVQGPLYIRMDEKQLHPQIEGEKKKAVLLPSTSYVYRANRARMVKLGVHIQNGSILQTQLLFFPTTVPVGEGAPTQHARHSWPVHEVSAAVRESVIWGVGNIQVPMCLRGCWVNGRTPSRSTPFRQCLFPCAVSLIWI